MKRSTINITQGSASNVVEAKLGDIFFINSSLKAYNNSELCELRPVVSMVTAIRSDKRVWLFSACVDHSIYSISRINNNKISLLCGKKETTININDIKNILLTQEFPTRILGIRMYGALIATHEEFMSQMDMTQVNARMSDVSKWPTKAIDIWAKRQKGLTSQELLKVVERCSRPYRDGEFVNSIVLSSVINRWHSAELKKKEKSTKFLSDGIPFIVQKLKTMRIWHAYNTRFIKIHTEEIVGGNIVFRDDGSIKPGDIPYYSVLVIRDLPSYIVVGPDDDSDFSLKFVFVSGAKLSRKVQIFTTESFKRANKKAVAAIALYNPSLSTTHDAASNEEVTLREAAPSFPSFVESGAEDFLGTTNVVYTDNNLITLNAPQPDTIVSVDANGDVGGVDVAEMGRAPSEIEEPEVNGGYLPYQIEPEVATEEEEE